MSEAASAAALYCGGCNPRYDRVAMVKRLGLPVWKAGSCTLLVVVCGCRTRCAAYGHIPAQRVLVIDGPEGEQTTLEILTTE